MVALIIVSVDHSFAQTAVNIPGQSTDVLAPSNPTTPTVTTPSSTSQTNTTVPPPAPPPPDTEANRQAEAVTTPTADVASPTQTIYHGFGGEFESEPRRFQYGLKLSARGVYDDNITISQSNRLSDYYFALEGTLTLGFGDITGQLDNYLRLDYSPSLALFLDHSEFDAVQHFIRLGAQHRFARATITLDEEIAILDGTDLRTMADLTQPGSRANLDVGGRNRFETYNTRLNLNYDLTGKTFLSSQAQALITDYHSSGLISSEIISDDLFINYRYSDKLTIGLGGTAGYDFVENSSDETFEQANARLSYQLTGKVSVNASGGAEFRQFGDNSRGQYVSPVFELAAHFQPFDGTSLSISGHSRILNSGALAGQDYNETIIGAGLQQRFLQRVFLGLYAGYENAHYFANASGVSASRNDDYYYIEPTLDMGITRYWTIGGYYLHREDKSSLSNFGFRDNQIGFRTAMTF